MILLHCLLLLLLVCPLFCQRRQWRKMRKRVGRGDLGGGGVGGGEGSILRHSRRLPTRGIVRPPILILRGEQMVVGGSAVRNYQQQRPRPWG